MSRAPSSRRGESLLTLPSLLFLTLFFLVPSLILLTCAFKEKGLYGGFGEGWSSEAILSLFTKSHLYLLLKTLTFSLLATSLTLLLAIPTGYQIARCSPFWRRILLALIIVPSWSPFLIRIYAWKLLLHPEGLLKRLLESLSLLSTESLLLYNDGALLLVMVYTYLPFAILPIYTASLKFNWHLIEAALDLGCTRFKAFFHVFLPGISRGISTSILLLFIPFMGAYVIPDLVGGTQSEMLGNRIAQKTLIERDYPEASALSLLLAVATTLPLLLLSRSNRIGLDLGLKRGVE